MRKYLIIASLIVVAALTVSVSIFSSSRGSNVPGSEIPVESIENIEYVSINKFLSNEMSESESCAGLDKYVEKFLKRWEINGASLAVLKDGKLIYSKGYGWADKENGIQMDPGHILRLASLSKLITAAAIMKLQEDSLLSLSDRVFGEGGILDCDRFSHIYDKRCKEITIEQLLRHRGGFTTHRGDPLFTTREIMIWEKLDTVPDMDGMIEYVLSQRLGFKPGASTSYSNVGYLILSKIVEKVSGLSYEKYCQDSILHPAGCYDMHLAKNLYEERYPNEVRYYETRDAERILAYNNSGDSLYRRYGGSNVEGLSGAGAWVASPTEYTRFVASIDGDTNVPDILSNESVSQMISTHEEGELPIGWVRAGQKSDWIRTGTLAGTSAIVKRQKDGFIWMFVTNTSSWKGSKFPKYIEYMIRTASSDIQWPERNLFEASSPSSSKCAGRKL